VIGVREWARFNGLTEGSSDGQLFSVVSARIQYKLNTK
jgi:hypothetical protein